MIQEIISNQVTAADLPVEPSFWLYPPADLNLRSNETHVWLARLNDEKSLVMEQIISASERARAAKFRFELHKNLYIGSRAVLRIILGKYLQINPSRLRFEYNEFGKPFIAGEGGGEIKFNLSHSENLAVFAVTRSREIGVDIERVKPTLVDEAMVAQCLAPQERDFFQTLPKNKRESFFFECWTRKEAYLKACGTGLSTAPNQIETLPFANLSVNPFKTGRENHTSGWSLQSLPFIHGFAAAIAVEGSSPSLKFWYHNDC